MPGRCQDPPLERCRGEHFVRVSENGTRKAQERAAAPNKPKTRSASPGITAFLLALSGIDRQDRFTIFSEILDLSIPIARSRADFAGKHPCAPAIDASSLSLAIDSFAWLCAPTRTP
jgi:hypothetical protein